MTDDNLVIDCLLDDSTSFGSSGLCQVAESLCLSFTTPQQTRAVLWSTWGERIIQSNHWSDVGSIQELYQPVACPESLAPICNSLKNIKHINSNDCLNRVYCSSAASVAFILLRQQQQFTTFKRSFKRQSRMSVELGLIQWRMNVPFSGIYYSLVFLLCNKNLIYDFFLFYFSRSFEPCQSTLTSYSLLNECHPAKNLVLELLRHWSYRWTYAFHPTQGPWD